MKEEKQPTESPDKNGDEETNDATGSSARVRKRRLDVNPNLILSDGRSKRRKTPTPEPGAKDVDEDGVYDPKDPDRAQQLGNLIYGKIMGTSSSE